MRRLRPRATVLLYHRVATSGVDADPHGQAISPTTFERHMQLLKRRYHVEPLATIVNQLPGAEYRDRTVAVTFDDGYADTLTEASPIASRCDVPLTVFVTVEPVDGGFFWWDELAARLSQQAAGGETYLSLHAQLRQLAAPERRAALDEVGSEPPHNATARPLSTAELRELAGLPGTVVGAHTLTHPTLSALPREQQLHELQAGRAELEALIGAPVRLLSYPFGKKRDVTDETTHLAEQAGYAAAFMSVAGRIVPSSPRYRLPRLSVHEWTERELLRRIEACFGLG
jgi:peptidoglycan/xylan/chitin deacetylase (PgdA/CDA1 family)